MGKKGKKTKKQLEEELLKALAEQDEADALAAEQAAIKAAEEAELKRIADEEEAKRQQEEQEQLESEMPRVEERKNEFAENLKYEVAKHRHNVEWNKFVACDHLLQTVEDENEIQTYCSTVREDFVSHLETNKPQEKNVIEMCEDSEKVVADLLTLQERCYEEEDYERVNWCNHHIEQIRNLEQQKIDEAFSEFLQHIENLEQNSRAEVSAVWGNANDPFKIGFWGHLQTKGFRAKVIDHQKIAVTLELPKSIALQAAGHQIGVRSIYTAFDSVAGTKNLPSLSIGGVMRVELVSIPFMAKKIKGWTLRDVPPPDQELVRLAYPNMDHSSTASGALQPCKVEYRVPPHVVVRPTKAGKHVEVSYFDEKDQVWARDNIGEVHWDEEARKISFFSLRLAPFSITQDRFIDFPYKWWNIAPRIHPKTKEQYCELGVQGPRFKLLFVVSEQGVALRNITPKCPELQSLMFEPTPEGSDEKIQRFHTPAQILLALRQSGINLMPCDNDCEFLAEISPKCPETEARAYSDLAEISTCFDVTSSKHNRNIVAEQIIARIRPNPHGDAFDPRDPDTDIDYANVMFWPTKSALVQTLEVQDHPNTAIKEGHSTHAALFVCLEQSHPALMDKLNAGMSRVNFVEQVRQMMVLMRLLNFV